VGDGLGAGVGEGLGTAAGVDGEGVRAGADETTAAGEEGDGREEACVAEQPARKMTEKTAKDIHSSLFIMPKNWR
jgi:hypothetical protein